MGCPYEDRCLNGPNGKEQCFRCFNLALLRLPEDKIKQRLNGRTAKAKPNEPSYRQLEREVAVRFSKPLTARQYEARQNPGSGSVWFRPGDVLHPLLHIECKERGAEKSIRVEKEWLDKALEEASLTQKVPVVPFRFKGTEDIYVFMRLDDLVGLIQELQYLKEREV